jgi:Bacterial DNA polymerase III alpha NTPase domain
MMFYSTFRSAASFEMSSPVSVKAAPSMRWIYKTYGRERAALCATVIRYRARGALREVGKALGLTEDITSALASQVSGWGAEGITPKHAEELNLNLANRRLRLTLDLSRELIATPRHLSQHPGGFVLTRDRLDELVPIEPATMERRAVIEWDKDDIDALNFMKVDVLGLVTCHHTARLETIHHALYVKCRESMEREASPTACIIDSQSVKGGEKGGACIDPHGCAAGKKIKGKKRHAAAMRGCICRRSPRSRSIRWRRRERKDFRSSPTYVSAGRRPMARTRRTNFPTRSSNRSGLFPNMALSFTI